MKKMIEFLKLKWPALLLILIVLLALIFNPYSKGDDKNYKIERGDSVNKVEEEKYYRLLDGVESKESELKTINVAVMVENSSEAWPLSGLDKASIVYEVLAEGRIPRFIAIISSNNFPDEIGPVRSARKYFAEIAAQFKAVYMHVGGSPEALSLIKSLPVIDADEFSAGAYYWRSRDRGMPHNTYTSQELLDSFIERRGVEASEFMGWKFKDAETSDATNEILTHEIIVNYTPSTYQAKYIYFPSQNRYQRYQAKEPMLMKDGSEIWTDTVIVEEHYHEVLDAAGRRRVDVLGEGRAWVFRDGEVVNARWKREDVASLTRYYDQAGDEIEFNRGKIWINLIELNSFTPPNIEIQKTTQQ